MLTRINSSKISFMKSCIPFFLVLFVITVIQGEADIKQGLNISNVTGNGTRKAGVIRIAWLATYRLVYHFNASTSLGALAYSIDAIANNSTRLQGYTFEYKNSSCSPKDAVGVLFELLEDPTWQPDLFLGPICSGAMKPVAKLASYLNRPVFGWVSSDPPLADKSVYTTLVRFLGAINNLGDGVVLLLRRFNWLRVFIVSTKGLDYGELGRGLREVFRKEGDITVARWERDVPVSPSPDTTNLIYKRVKDEARIVLLCIPHGEIRLWALRAYHNKMHGGEYVFIYINQQITEPELYDSIRSPNFYIFGDDEDEKARLALANFFLMLSKTENFYYTGNFIDKFRKAANSEKWRNKFPGVTPAEPDFYSLFLYDALKVYSRFADVTGSINNGTAIFNAARGSFTSDGATGDVILDDFCDRIPDFHIFKMVANKTFDVVARTVSTFNGSHIDRRLDIVGDIIWGDGRVGPAFAPTDTPTCGFHDELCPHLADYIIPTTVTVFVVAIVTIATIAYRKARYELDLASTTWIINYSDINFYSSKHGLHSSIHSKLVPLAYSKTSVDSKTMKENSVTVGSLHGNIVVVKKITSASVQLTRALREEMRAMQEVQHSNLNTFIGASTEAPNIVCVWDYCTKGSLQDVIWNDNIQLDDMFKFSICIDILKGLSYLHGSGVRCHGRLSSANVVIDGHWLCKLTDYGQPIFTRGQRHIPSDNHSKLFWCAPETLREAMLSAQSDELPEFIPISMDPSADVYSAGVILKEVFCRNGPFTEMEGKLTNKEIVRRIMTKPLEDARAFRPVLKKLKDVMTTHISVTSAVEKCIGQLWRENPHTRLTANKSLKTMLALNPYKRANVLDNMISMMEKHSANLEKLVEKRTLEYEEEQAKTEELLSKIIPKSVAEELKAGRNVPAEFYTSATVYFSDIFGFTDLARESSPLEVVAVLNGLYTLFDETIPRHDVYKVETVGDVYMLVSGLPIRNGDRHVVEISNCALDIMSGVMGFKVPHKPEHQLKIRIGIHTGPIVSGVVGLTLPRFCLFGDTVNTASRMQSYGEPMKIHISFGTQQELSRAGGYITEERGPLTIKGKGVMVTHWLVGKESGVMPLPDVIAEIDQQALFQADSPTSS